MTTAHDLLQQGIEALKAGRKAEARNLLAQVVQQDQHNETAWLWLSGAVDKDSERRLCLERVLAINPSNGIAKRGLAAIQRRMGEVSPLTRAEKPAVEPQPASPTPGPVALQAPRLQPASPLPTEAGHRLLEREIRRYTKQGWQLVSQSETSAQLRKGKQWSQAGILLFVVLPLIGGCFLPALFGVALFGLLLVLADYMLKKEKLKYITVEQLEQRRAKAQASARKGTTEQLSGLVIGIVASGLALAGVAFVAIWWVSNSELLRPGPTVEAPSIVTAAPPVPAATHTPRLTSTPDRRSPFEKCVQSGQGVRYVITGDGVRSVSLTWENDTGGTEQGDYIVPFCNPYSGFRRGDFLYISAQIIKPTSGAGSIQCRIYDGDSVIAEANARGFASIATCSGSAR